MATPACRRGAAACARCRRRPRTATASRPTRIDKPAPADRRLRRGHQHPLADGHGHNSEKGQRSAGCRHGGLVPSRWRPQPVANGRSRLGAGELPTIAVAVRQDASCRTAVDRPTTPCGGRRCEPVHWRVLAIAEQLPRGKRKPCPGRRHVPFTRRKRCVTHRGRVERGPRLPELQPLTCAPNPQPPMPSGGEAAAGLRQPPPGSEADTPADVTTGEQPPSTRSAERML